MENVRCVGLDVHEESITLAVAEPDGTALVLRRMPHDLAVLVKQLKELGAHSKVKVAYEAGACGMGLWRRLNNEGIECFVVAPSKIPRDGRQKTDKEDAIRLARFLRSGDLVSVYVPDAETEALRGLTRAREDAIEAQQRARGQLRNFLVHENLRYEGKSSWTKAHHAWIKGLTFAHAATTIVRDDYLREVEAVAARIARLTKDIEVLAPQSSRRPMIEALQSLRGVQLVTAATLALEIGNFSRFEKAKHLMSYLGLVNWPRLGGHPRSEGEDHDGETKAANLHPGVQGGGGRAGQPERERDR